MKRPFIKQRDVQEYVHYLEGRLEKFEANTTINKFYKGVKKQVDNISELFNHIEVTEVDLKDKDDKFFDRYFKYLEKADAISEGLIKMEQKVAPTGQKQKILEDASVEKHIFQ